MPRIVALARVAGGVADGALEGRGGHRQLGTAGSSAHLRMEKEKNSCSTVPFFGGGWRRKGFWDEKLFSLEVLLKEV